MAKRGVSGHKFDYRLPVNYDGRVVLFLVALLPVCISVVDDQLIAPASYVAPIWCNCAWVLHKVVQVALHPKLTDVGGRRAEAPKKVDPVLITPTGCFVASQRSLSLRL